MVSGRVCVAKGRVCVAHVLTFQILLDLDRTGWTLACLAAEHSQSQHQDPRSQVSSRQANLGVHSKFKFQVVPVSHHDEVEEA
jgi:hypothetical protein